MTKLFSTMLCIAGLCAANLSAAAELTIHIDDVKAAGGQLMISVYNSADSFLKKPLSAMRTAAKATDNSVTVKDLPPGDYAVVVFHDVNENGKMDKNILGIPTEDYGFSNNATGKMGPPSFELAKLTLTEAGLSTHLSLH